MTLNLKLVKRQDGKWTALTPETDGIVQVTERKSAPIDPAQLLKALDSLLSVEGGIRSIEDVPRLASLMKKFSKKLVSRCVYCNVLQSTKPEILSEYLDKGGWETINTWLQYAKSSSCESFLLEMLKLCKSLPMTLNRLKENNTAKLIKSLTKHENVDVKELSNLLVNQWMSIIKENKNIESSSEKKKKKDKAHKSSKNDKVEPSKVDKVEPVKVEPAKVDKVEPSKVDKVEPPKVDKAESPKEAKSPPKPVAESPKGPNKIRNLKRASTEKETKLTETYEDVKIDPEPLMPVAKKPRADRPKTAKIYQKKFRATGLEEETPLPKNITKKTATVDKSAVAAAKSTLKLNTSPLDRITEKKIKPESLMAVNENANTKGIKLIPAKPRPTYVLHESASFIDALISQPVAPVKRKKKVSPKPSPTTAQPTSPTMAPPKLQFYKDTLEEKMSENKTEENKTEDTDKIEEEITEAENDSENGSTNPEEIVPMEVTEEGGHTPPNEEIVGNQSPTEESEFTEEVRPKMPFDPNNLRSILSHGKRRGRKKSVRWVEDNNIKEIFYFEMDDTERVNVSKNQNQNFYDLKFIEMRRERETMELAKRQAGDRVEEFRRWWDIPILIDVPPPLVVPGYQSQEKLTEHARQQSTLQEIYFTKEMIPDSPHEPDLEIVAQKEPKVIPLDEENLISTLNDFSNYKPMKACLPEILSTLMKINANQLLPQASPNIEPVQMKMDMEPIQPPLLKMDPIINQPNMLIPSNPHNPPGPEPLLVPPNGLLGHIPAPYQSPPPDVHGSEIPGEWQGPPPDVSPNDFYSAYPINQNMPTNNHPPAPPSGMNIRGGPPASNAYRPNFRGAPRGITPRGRSRVVCRHFAAGHCRFGMSCTFLHPGVNGPHL